MKDNEEEGVLESDGDVDEVDVLVSVGKLVADMLLLAEREEDADGVVEGVTDTVREIVGVALALAVFVLDADSEVLPVEEGVRDAVAVAVFDPLPDKLTALGRTEGEKLALFEENALFVTVAEPECEIEPDTLPVAEAVAVAVVDGVSDSDKEEVADNDGEADGLVDGE